MSAVRARRAPELSIRRARWNESVVRTLWFVPVSATIAAIVASRATVAYDRSRSTAPGWTDALLPGDPTALASAGATIASAMLTFLAVVFATTLVAIQLASSQYSPRIVRIFVRSRETQISLAVFLVTFVWALNTLVATREEVAPFVPATTASIMYVLVLATVCTFVAYMHHMVRLLRVQYLLRLTARASHDAIDHAIPPEDHYTDVTAPDPVGAPVEIVAGTVSTSRTRGTPRVLQAVDVAGLAVVAARLDGWIDVRIAVGEHAGPLTTIAAVHAHAVPDDAVAEIRRYLLFGSERTLLQDPGFGIRQLVDTASRALSPAISDPTTAVQALMRIEDLLARISRHPDPSGWYVDAAGAPRVRLNEPSFDRLVTLGLTEILHYGADAPQVTRALLAVCHDLAAGTDGARRDHVDSLIVDIRGTVEQRVPGSLRQVAVTPDRMGLG